MERGSTMEVAVRSPRVEIEYCTGCRWGLRAGWIAQELLSSFEGELGEIALVPGRVGGVFVVRLDGVVLFDRAEVGRFPELREVKQAVRDRIAPERSLGHSDRPTDSAADRDGGIGA
ncbi:MAG: SelT/SelW/SelH family protein [Myxococcota bacterium]